jgi:hypothetical protein
MKKANTFLDHILSLPNNPSDVTKENCKKRWTSIIRLAGLYEKEFKSAMIPAYFAGWEVSLLGTFTSKSGSKEFKIVCFDFMEKDKEISYRWENVPKGIYQEGKRTLLKMPSTLDQFISDCIRSGIELRWKDEIVENYFN